MTDWVRTAKDRLAVGDRVSLNVSFNHKGHSKLDPRNKGWATDEIWALTGRVTRRETLGRGRYLLLQIDARNMDQPTDPFVLVAEGRVQQAWVDRE
jgi:hypothetical protein